MNALSWQIDGRSGGTTADPADRVALDESINMAFLVVLESMTPAGRVAFILHDVFCYSCTEVEWGVGPDPPFHTPVFVLTHHPRPSVEMEGGTTFHFIDAFPVEATSSPGGVTQVTFIRAGL